MHSSSVTYLHLLLRNTIKLSPSNYPAFVTQIDTLLTLVLFKSTLNNGPGIRIASKKILVWYLTDMPIKKKRGFEMHLQNEEMQMFPLLYKLSIHQD